VSAAGPPLPPADLPRDERPVVVQSDGTVLLDVTGPHAVVARDALAAFAHLERSPEYVHTYRITPLSLWNAAAAGVGAEHVEEALARLSRYPVPELVGRTVRDAAGRFGRLRLVPNDDGALLLLVPEPALRRELGRSSRLVPFWAAERENGFAIRPLHRGALKQALIKEGWPVEDLCGYAQGRPLPFRLRARMRADGAPFALRAYQKDAVAAFHAGGGVRGGAGVIALPCGAGKTVVGIGAMERLQTSTLVLTTSTVAVHQWRDELLDKTDLAPEAVGEYTGHAKEIRPVTITTYQMLTHRKPRSDASPDVFPHMDLVRWEGWGLLIYDEVHTLPAPVFRVTAEIQARRRLGLTATLVREDGREDDVFALIGPKRFDVPWKVLEAQGFIADATCYELRLEMSEARRMDYAVAEKRDRFRLAAENPSKIALVEELIRANPDDQVLVIGQYIDQLETIARDLALPLLTGRTPNAERERLYAAFRRGEFRALVVSKVANFAIDLPDASLAIQVSGTFGSRQEEAQRLGRLLRPKERAARFYTLVSRDTCEQEFAARRQLFLVEQGYCYRIIDVEETPDEDVTGF
jgi:DNA excision repair protein ERCC-3